MVVLVAGDDALSRVISAADGSFTLSVPDPGRYRVRLDRIGYASTFSDAFDVAPGETVELVVDVVVRPVVLRGLEVVGGSRCTAGPGQTEATATVWEEGRKALELARWTSERELYRFAWVRYVRELDRGGERVLDEQRSRRSAFTPHPFESIDPDTLAVFGFVRDEGGTTIYTAPDAEVLLSGTFLGSHCFALDRKEDDGRVLIGLRFRPINGRSLPEVDGVAWLDETTGRLESLEYEYVNLNRAADVRGEDASGRIFFREIPNGTWIVQEWSIRMPRLVEIRDDFGRPRRYDVRGYVEEGGAVTQVATATGVQLSGSQTAIHGTVTDSTGAPAAGARVWIDGTDLEARTDSEGVFTVADIGAGTWSVRASHPSLAMYGHEGSAAEVAVERNSVRQVQFGLPSISAVVSLHCESTALAEAEVVTLAGRVLNADGIPVRNAAVRVIWSQVRGSFRRSFEGFGTDSDSIGVFTVCDVPPGRMVMATASIGDLVAEAPELSLDDASGVVPIEIRFEPARNTDAARPSEGRGDDASPEALWLDSLGFYDRSRQALLH